MTILETEVEIEVNGTSKQHYINRGYNLNFHHDRRGVERYKRGTKIKVKIEDLPVTSRIQLTLICDKNPEHIYRRQYRGIVQTRQKFGIDVCEECTRLLKHENKRNKLDYESSAEFYLIESKREDLINLFNKDNEKSLKNLTRGSGLKVLWNCEIYGELHKHEQTVHAKIIENHKCPYCLNQKVKQGFNDMWTTNPTLASLLENAEDGRKFTEKSSKKANFKCPECGYVLKNRIISNMCKQGLRCPSCKDGISYPEKFVFNLLKQSEMNFEFQKNFSWASKNRYDFFIEELSLIIEVHGAQHFCQKKQFGNKKLEEQIKNDLRKKNIASRNGILNYIVIDASESNCDFIKHSIEASELNGIINLKEIKWEECNMYALSSLVIKSTTLWNQNYTTNQIAKELKITVKTVIQYLRQGEDAGLCKYERYRKLNKKIT